MTDSLRLEQTGSVARVTLTRPEIHNAFDDGLVALLSDVAVTLTAEKGIRVVVLAGEGKSFCAGADLNWMKRMVDYGHEENVVDSVAMAKMFEAWNRLAAPVVGRIHGAALGGGTGLVSVCDIAIAAEEATFGFTEVRLGILPAVISPFVMGKIGRAAARHLFLTGERFSAARAYELGLVQRVVPGTEIDAAVDATVQSLLAGGPEAQRRIKQLIPEVAGLSPEKARSTTAETIAAARASREGQEGMHAFFDRRRPAWREED